MPTETTTRSQGLPKNARVSTSGAPQCAHVWTRSRSFSVPQFQHFTRSPGRSVELHPRTRLLRSDASRGDVRLEIVLALHGRAREAPEHRDLADVRQCVRDRPLEQLLDGAAERLLRGESLVESAETLEEARRLRFPRDRLRGVPRGLATSERARPVQEVAHVG